MKPLDPRLLRRARAARGYVALTGVLGLATAVLAVAQALLLAAALAPVATAATRGEALPDVSGHVRGLIAVVLARAVLTWTQERYGHRAAGRVIADLREQVLDQVAALGPRRLAEGDGPRIATLLTRGLDALEPYFVKYVPQLLLAATVTPATLAVVFGLDLVAAVTITVTIPLVPIFMVLVGRLTEGRSERGLATMQRLGAQVLDLLAGLPTLRSFGREHGPAVRVRELGQAHRLATMSTLRIAFLSGMVLELLTSLSVALVAVGIGMRLVYGEMSLEVGLAVLILAPEVYLPLRQVGAHFHSSTDGMAASDAALALLAEHLTGGTTPAPDLRRAIVRLHDVSVTAGDRDTRAPDHLTCEIRPGRVVALTGASGAGKSTTVALLTGLLAPSTGRVTVALPDTADIDVTDLDRASWWSQIAWVPQRPVLTPGTILEAVLGRSDADGPTPALLHAARVTGLDAVVESLPSGWAARVGQGGHGLSLGQRQRLALTRALLLDAPLVVLDEPSAHLDTAAEVAVLDAVRALRAAGRTVVLVAHRPTLVACADDVVEVVSSEQSATVAQ